MTTEEFIELYEKGELKTKGGTFWFCGTYHFGKPLDNFYELKSIRYDNTENNITIETSHGTAQIINPKHITEEKGYGGYRFKMDGDLVRFQYEHESKLNRVEYRLTHDEAISKHENGFQQIKPPFDEKSLIFEFGE